MKKHLKTLRKDAGVNGKKMQISKVQMGMAAGFDSVGSSLQIISLLLIPASVYFLNLTVF